MTTPSEGKTVAVSGSGNVAIYATQKAQQLGAKVVTLSDSTGWIHDPAGIDVDLVKQIKEVERGRISEYAKRKEGVEYHDGRGVWSVPVDIALPCATQNELLIDDAKQLVANGCQIVAEGANMPTTMDATDYLMENGVVFCPARRRTPAALPRPAWRCRRTPSASPGRSRKWMPSCRAS